MAELRKNPLTREWVIVAAAPPALGDSTKPCPYCPGNEALSAPELLSYRDPKTAPDSAGWRVRVVANAASYFQGEGDLGRRDERIYDTMCTVGGDEIVVESPAHDEAALISDPLQSEDALWACRERYSYWSACPSVKSVILARRHPPRHPGHPHWRLLALPVVPQALWELAKGMEQYYDYRARCGVCHIVQAEAQDGGRIVAQNRHFLAITPYFAKDPYELWIAPRRHHGTLADAHRHEMQNLAEILAQSLAALRHALHDPCLVVTFMCAPCNVEGLEHFHWFARVLPTVAAPDRAAVEYGISVNHVAPEAAAAQLRRAMPAIISRKS